MIVGKWLHFLMKLQPYNVLKGIRYLRHFGVKAFFIRLSERMEPEEVPYGPWYAYYQPTEKELDQQRRSAAGKKFAEGPVFSVVVPVYRTPETYLRQMIDSVIAQTYPKWELCIVNADPSDYTVAAVLEEYRTREDRIRIKALEHNAGIAGNTNEGLQMASGDWIALLDHDDLLSPSALYQFARYLKEHADEHIGMLYSDEDKVRETGGSGKLEHIDPNLKSDFNLDLLRANNYICHLLCVRSDIAKAQGMDPAYDGAQDYDFIFRCAESAGYQHVAHVPEILYHWRVHSASTSDNPLSKGYAYEAGRRAIADHLDRCGIAGAVVEQKKDFGFYRVRYACPETKPLVSILIPNRDQADMLRTCLESIRDVSTYSAIEVIIIENNSHSKDTLALYRELISDPKYAALHIRIIRWKGAFNYAAINNFGARHARGAYLLLLNNDIEVITPGWIEEMLSVCARPEVGAVGVRLYYPDHTYQHAGIVVGIGGVAGSMFVNMKQEREGYLHKAALMQDMSAVTAACLMIRTKVFKQIGGFEETLAVAFNDVDLCLRLREQGYLVVYDPYAELLHYESKSRGAEDTKKKVRRFQTEIEFMRTRWEKLLIQGDPMYNKNLSLSKWNYSLKDKERMR